MTHNDGWGPDDLLGDPDSEPRFEHDGPPAEIDESLAETQAALDAQRDFIDEAASLPDDGHEDEREELHGNGLMWWRDTSLIEAHRAMGSLFDEALEDFDRAKLLIENGVDADTMPVEWHLNFQTGPLALAGLQLLGLFVPEFREAIADLLKTFPFPVATEEENAQIEAAVEKLTQEARAKAEAILAALAQRQAPLASEQDARLGLDPN